MARFVLDWRTKRDPQELRAYLDAVLQDLTTHQLGLIAGVQEAIQAILHKLDPKVVESEAQRAQSALGRVAGTLVPGQAAWKQYLQSYHETFENNNRLYQQLIYPNLKQGYLRAHDGSVPTSKKP
jgi:predicted component of type VI protein secretion system